MSSGYLYEINRKSENIEDSNQRSNLRTFSEEEEDEIWEVPEESFDNAYQPVENDEDEDNDEIPKEKDDNAVSSTVREVINAKNPLNVFQNFEIFSAQKLRLSLSAEQISLKTQEQQWENSTKAMQQTINKAINTEADATRPMTVNVNNTSTTNITGTTSTTTTTCSSVKWKNVKINQGTEKTQQSWPLDNVGAIPNNSSQTESERNVLLCNVPEIKLSSSAKFPIPRINHSNACSNRKLEMRRKLSLESVSVTRPHVVLREPPKCCSSPESLLDNILSAASSVSVESSSLSSCILTDDGEPPKRKSSNPFNSEDKHSGGDVAKNTLCEFKRCSGSTKSSILNQHTFHLQQQQPSIMVTHASLSSSSTINNISNNSESSEAFDTASTISRNSTQTRGAAETRVTPPGPEITPKLPPALVCLICKGIFKDPRCLNCLHTFCFDCIVEENFKHDVSNPFSTTSLPSKMSSPQPKQPAQQYLTNSPEIEQNLKVSNSPSSDTKSSSPELKTENNNLNIFEPAAGPLQKRSSFSFKLRRSSDNSPSKTKSDVNKTLSYNSTVSNQTPANLLRTIVCRICQFATDVPMGGLRQLPRNLLMIRKIDDYRSKMADERRSSCTLCYEKTNATHYCGTCALNLCTLCKESHERQRSTADHNIRNIIELQIDQHEVYIHPTIDNAKLTLKCSLHLGFDVKSFCTSCLQVACTDCLILQHKGHKHEPIEKAIKYYLHILRDSTEQTRLICKSAEHSLDKLNASSLAINRKCDELQAEVEEFMQRYIEAVEGHKTMLLQQIKRARETKVDMIVEQQVEFEKRTQEGHLALNFSQELTEVASDVEILSFIKILLKRFEYCQQFKAPVDPKITNTPNFLPKIQATANKDPKDIPVYGIITMQTVEPSLCTLQWDGFSQLRLNKKVDLALISRDADGLPMCHGGLKIQTHVKYKDLNSKCLRMEVSDNNDGTYCIAFTPDSEGTIILMITINEKHIKGSPFSFLVRSVRPHSGIYHCCTFCSSKGNKFATCSCEGNMPGYNGCGHGHTGHPGRRHWSCCGNVMRNSECYFANRSLNPK